MQAARCVATQTRSLIRSQVIPQSFQEMAVRRITGRPAVPAPGGKSGTYLSVYSLAVLAIPFLLVVENSLKTFLIQPRRKKDVKQ